MAFCIYICLQFLTSFENVKEWHLATCGNHDSKLQIIIKLQWSANTALKVAGFIVGAATSCALFPPDKSEISQGEISAFIIRPLCRICANLDILRKKYFNARGTCL
jgi:hypothetical protein